MANIRLPLEMHTAPVDVQTPPNPSVSGITPTPLVSSPMLGTSNEVPNLVELKKKPLTRGDTVTATLAESVTARMLRGLDYLTIPAEEGFDVVKALGPRAADYSRDELASLYDARSTTELTKRIAAIQESRNNMKAMAANPITAMATSMLDIDVAIGGTVGAMSKASRLTRMAAAAVETAGALKLASEGGPMSQTEATLWMVGATLAAIPNIHKAKPKANAVVPPMRPDAGDIVPSKPAPTAPTLPHGATAVAEQAMESGVQDILTKGQAVPEAPTKPIKYMITDAGDIYYKNDAGNVQLLTGRIPDGSVKVDMLDTKAPNGGILDAPKMDTIKDPDYPIKPVQEAPSTPYVKHGNSYATLDVDGNYHLYDEPPKHGIELKSIDELEHTVDTPNPRIPFDMGDGKPRNYFNTSPMTATVRDAVGAVLATGAHLPEDLKRLATSLFDGLSDEAPIPMRFSSTLGDEFGPEVTGYYEYYATRAGHAKVKVAPERLNAVQDLTGFVRGLDVEEIGTLLHEATHAKVDNSIYAVDQGIRVSKVVRDSVDQLKRVHDYVMQIGGKLPAKYLDSGEIGYAMSDIHEFAAQVFSAPDFREMLNSIEWKNKPILQRIKKAFVHMITGQPLHSGAMDEVDKALTNLFGTKTRYMTDKERSKIFGIMKTAKSQHFRSLAKTPAGFKTAMETINGALSTFEAIKNLGPKFAALAPKLLVDSTGTAANSAAHYARAALLQGNVGHMLVQSSMAQALVQDGWNLFKRFLHPMEYRRAAKSFSEEVYNAIAENAGRYADGLEILPHKNPLIQKVLQDFEGSNWASDWLKNIKAAGVEGASDILENPWYLPRSHDYNKIVDAMRKGLVTQDDIIGMYAEQFKRIFADRGMEDATAKKLGKQMFKNIQDRGLGTTDWRSGIAGMGFDDIRDALEHAGVSEEQIKQFLGEAQQAGKEANKPTNLRRRMDFDMTMPYITKQGRTINMDMFVRKDVASSMEGYGRRMAGRVGLAKAGYPDLRTLDADITKALQEVTGDMKVARELVDNTIKHLLGMPTGERVPDLFRTINILSSATNLGNSGIFQLADSALVVQEYGLLKTIKALMNTKFGRNALELARSPEFGSRFKDVLEGNLVLQGMYRPLLTHLDDNFEVAHMAEFHQLIQHLGQNTRFASGLEFVRRGQVKLVAGMIADSLEGAIKGSADDINILKRYGLTDDILAKVKAAREVIPDIRMWDRGLVLDVNAILTNAADALVLENRLGDIAPWLQFSSVGKVIMPYLSFVSGAWNKLLRRRYRMDGFQGVMMSMAYQMPAAVLASAASMEIRGKELDAQKVVAKAITQTPITSWFGYAVDFLTQGPANSIAALSIADKSYSAMKSILQGKPDAEKIINAMPWISLIPPVKMYGATINEDEETK